MAEEAKAEKVDEAPAAPKGAGRGGKLVPILLSVNSLISAAVLALVVLRAPLRHEPKPAEEPARPAAATPAAPKAERSGKEAAPGPMLRLPDFVVHLRDGDADHYARVAFEVELADEKAKELLTSRTAQIRDVFISYLSDRTADDLRGSEAIARLKSVLAQKIAEAAPAAALRGLYVADLVVQ